MIESLSNLTSKVVLCVLTSGGGMVGRSKMKLSKRLQDCASSLVADMQVKKKETHLANYYTWFYDLSQVQNLPLRLAAPPRNVKLWWQSKQTVHFNVQFWFGFITCNSSKCLMMTSSIRPPPYSDQLLVYMYIMCLVATMCMKSWNLSQVLTVVSGKWMLTYCCYVTNL